MRLFIALTLPDHVKNELYKKTSSIQKVISNGNFSHSSNYHITLVFLGETDKKEIPIIKQIINETTDAFIPMHLASEQTGMFGNNNKKVLYYSLSGEIDLLSDIQQHLYNRLFQKGLCKEQEKYIPHITFARNIKCDNIVQVNSSVAIFSSSVSLMHSHRANNQLTYTPIYTSGFKGSMVIDRIESNVVIFESNGKIYNSNQRELPAGIAEGDCIVYNGDDFKIDMDKKIHETQRLRNKFETLKGE